MMTVGIATVQRDLVVRVPGAGASETRRLVAVWLASVADQITAVPALPEGWTVTVEPVSVPTVRADIRPDAEVAR